MRLRYWIARARSGEVLGEATVSGQVSLTSRLGGGSCSLDISVAALDEDRTTTNWPQVERLANRTRGGAHSLVVTDDTGRLLGEWLLMSREMSTDSDVISVSGVGWEAWPSMRATNIHHVYKDVSQATIARDLLDRAFLSFNEMALSIGPFTSAVTRTIEYYAGSAYYSDLLDEIAAPDDGFEWAVDVTPSWDGDRLVSVSRQVVFGAPVLSRPSSLVFEAGEPGTRHGNAVISGGDDFARSAQSVHGIGSGEGAKRLHEWLSDYSLAGEGYMFSTRSKQWSNINKAATLIPLVQAELSAGQDLRDPYEARARVDALPSLPQVGMSARLLCPRSWAWPGGLDESLRIGQVSYTASGPVCDEVSVLAA